MKKFSCHGCGGCCHGPIALTLKEARHNFYNDFPLVVTFVVSDVRNVPVEKEKTRYAKGMKKFTRDVIGFYDKTDSNRKIVVHPQILTLLPPDSPCVHLDEFNRCSIYQRKPSVCTLYPVRIDTPIHLIEEGLFRERNQAYEGLAHIPCQGWAEDAEVFFLNGEPVDPKTIPMLKQRSQEAMETRDLMKGFYSVVKTMEGIPEKIERYSQVNIETNQFIQLPFSMFISWMIDNNHIHPIIGKELIENQLQHLNESLEKNKVRNDAIGETFETIFNDHIEKTTSILSNIFTKPRPSGQGCDEKS